MTKRFIDFLKKREQQINAIQELSFKLALTDGTHQWKIARQKKCFAYITNSINSTTVVRFSTLDFVFFI